MNEVPLLQTALLVGRRHAAVHRARFEMFFASIELMSFCIGSVPIAFGQVLIFIYL